MLGFADRIRRLRGDIALARKVGLELQALQALQADNHTRSQEINRRVETLEQRVADAQVQMAFLVTELDRLNGLYETAMNRVRQLELSGRALSD